jgi:hypothetical protein
MEATIQKIQIASVQSNHHESSLSSQQVDDAPLNLMYDYSDALL